MAQPTLLSIAKADLISAGRLVEDEDKFIKHQAAYFVQQSIEKTLKYLIYLKTGTQSWGHDIAKLIMQARQLGIQVPREIDSHKTVYTSWEAVTRYYPQEIIRRDAIKRAIAATKQWHVDLTKQGIR